MNKAWDDFFEGEYTTKNGGIIHDTGQFLVSTCKFEKSNQVSINFNESNNDDNKLLAEFCSFYDIITESQFGTAIFFLEKGEVVMNRLCGVNCNCGEGAGQFSRTRATNEENHQNFMNFSTIFSCGLEDTGYTTCSFEYGKFQMTQTNFTKCNTKGSAAFFAYQVATQSFSELSTLANCSVSYNDDVIAEFYESKNALFQKLNILYNKGSRIISNHGSVQLKVEECVFFKNDATCLIFTSAYPTIVIHCYFDDTSEKLSFSVGGSFDTESMSTDKFDNKLYDIKWCEAIKLMNKVKQEATCNIIYKCVMNNGEFISLFALCS